MSGENDGATSAAGVEADITRLQDQTREEAKQKFRANVIATIQDCVLTISPKRFNMLRNPPSSPVTRNSFYFLLREISPSGCPVMTSGTLHPGVAHSIGTDSRGQPYLAGPRYVLRERTKYIEDPVRGFVMDRHDYGVIRVKVGRPEHCGRWILAATERFVRYLRKKPGFLDRVDDVMCIHETNLAALRSQDQCIVAIVAHKMPSVPQLVREWREVEATGVLD